jgi:hypothetical protein
MSYSECSTATVACRVLLRFETAVQNRTMMQESTLARGRCKDGVTLCITGLDFPRGESINTSRIPHTKSTIGELHTSFNFISNNVALGRTIRTARRRNRYGDY